MTKSKSSINKIKFHIQSRCTLSTILMKQMNDMILNHFPHEIEAFLLSNYIAWVTDVTSRIVCLLLLTNRREETPMGTCLSHICTESDCRRRKLAQRLIEHVETWMMETQGVVWPLFTWISPNDKISLDLFQKCHFHIVDIPGLNHYYEYTGP